MSGALAKMIENTGVRVGKSHPLIAIVENDAAAARELANEISHLELVWRSMSSFTIPLVVELPEGADSRTVCQGSNERRTLRAAVHASADDFIRSLNEGNIPDVLMIDEDIFVRDEELARLQDALSEMVDIQVICMADSPEMENLLSGSIRVSIIQNPVTKSRLMKALSRAILQIGFMREHDGRSRPLCLRYRGIIYLVRPSEIQYAENRARTLLIYLDEKSHGEADPIAINMSLEQFMQFLPGNFLQVHKSFLVNLDYVFMFANDAIVLRSGKKIPVSQRRRQYVIREIYRYGRDISS